MGTNLGYISSPRRMDVSARSARLWVRCVRKRKGKERKRKGKEKEKKRERKGKVKSVTR